MSIKIQHGFRIDVDSFAELDAWRRKTFAAFQKDAYKRLHERYSQHAVYTADSWIVLPKWKKPVKFETERGYEDNVAMLAHSIFEEGMKESRSHCERDNYFLDITIHPVDGMFLCLVFGNSSTVESWFRNQPKVVHFPYWDNTDRPNDMTQEQWDDRGDLWEKALENKPPVETGYSIRSEDPTSMLFSIVWDKHKYPLIVPKTHLRTRRLARMIVESNLLQAYRGDTNISMSKVMEILRRARRHPGCKNFMPKIKTQLPKIYSWKTLQKMPATVTKKDKK